MEPNRTSSACVSYNYVTVSTCSPALLCILVIILAALLLSIVVVVIRFRKAYTELGERKTDLLDRFVPEILKTPGDKSKQTDTNRSLSLQPTSPEVIKSDEPNYISAFNRPTTSSLCQDWKSPVDRDVSYYVGEANKLSLYYKLEKKPSKMDLTNSNPGSDVTLTQLNKENLAKTSQNEEEELWTCDETQFKPVLPTPSQIAAYSSKSTPPNKPVNHSQSDVEATESQLKIKLDREDRSIFEPAECFTLDETKQPTSPTTSVKSKIQIFESFRKNVKKN